MFDADAGAGKDTLIADFSGLPADGNHAYFISGLTRSGKSYSGILDSDFALDSGYDTNITFTGVENFQLTLENADDVVTTGIGNDILNGGGGRDQLDVGSGNDSADGGDEIDGIAKDYSATGEDIHWSLIDNTFSGPGGDFKNFEYFLDLKTGRGNDVIVSSNATYAGQLQVDKVATGAGNDSAKFFGGNDSYDGGAGNDTLILDLTPFGYGSMTQDFTRHGKSYSGGIAYELGNYLTTLKNVEDFQITLGNSDNDITTGIGNDIVNGGANRDRIDIGSGNDSADGGAGVDGIAKDYSGAHKAIHWSLIDYTFSGPGGDFKNFEYFIDLKTGRSDDVIVSSNATYAGQLQSDKVATGAGNDSAKFFGGNDSYDGGAGEDTLIVDLTEFGYGTTAQDFTRHGKSYLGEIVYQLGTLQVTFANVENFELTLGYGDDVATTGVGNDILNGQRGRDMLDGDSGNDVLIGGDGGDTLTGGAGKDIFRYEAASDSINAFYRLDTITDFRSRQDRIDLSGFQLYDYSLTKTGKTTVLSGIGAGGSAFYLSIDAPVRAQDVDLVSYDRTIDGTAHNDRLSAPKGANAQIDGGAGNDRLTGGDGLDHLIGGDGNDRLAGGGGGDLLEGGDGKDRLDGGAGGDILVGGAGNDTYVIDDAGDFVIEAANGGVDTINSAIDYTLGAEQENLKLTGSALNGNGNDLANAITANGLNNALNGNNGDDVLRGLAGDDTLSGGSGKDTIYGGTGIDRLYGGADGDVFRFDTGDTGATRTTADTIFDFSHADHDKIHLAAIDANTTRGGTQAFAFIGTDAFGGHAGELRYSTDGSSTLIEGDTDGDGVADLAIILSGQQTLVAGDCIGVSAAAAIGHDAGLAGADADASLLTVVVGEFLI